MKPLSENLGLKRLRVLKDRLRADMAVYEQKAEPCATCDTPGECCLDEHFVNVRITRLEAVAIANVLEALPPIHRSAVRERVLNAAGQAKDTFACPLYERGTGCLVHRDAKPVPCIVHACYDSEADLPPDSLQDAAELSVARLNEIVYRDRTSLEPLPDAVSAVSHARNGSAT